MNFIGNSVLVAVGLFAMAVTAGAGDGTTSRVPDRAEDIRPVLVGTTMPAIQLADMNGNPVNLNALVGRKPTVLVYYRGGW